MFLLATSNLILDVIKRELNSSQGNIHFVHSSNYKSFVRSLVWSKVLSTKQPESDVENKTVDSKAEQQKPTVKVVVPNLKERNIKAGDVKIVLENIKEQSLSKETTTAETLKQIKEKIFDTKPKETEPEKGNMIVLIGLFGCFNSSFSCG